MTSPSNDAAPPPPPSPLDSPHVRRRPAPSYPSGAAPRIVATPANAPRDPPSPPTRQLIRPLLKTRSEAEAALSAFLETADEERVALLKAAGATIRYRHR
ncbi:hypothetical protein PLICRDRAFT_44828 [Plicaturopsis crispa FD-325 SS-3]|nr:hypothetical protein PLICRDRAFT_44828 [Plicaturopsis crispa FD-325 SS-3]